MRLFLQSVECFVAAFPVSYGLIQLAFPELPMFLSNLVSGRRGCIRIFLAFGDILLWFRTVMYGSFYSVTVLLALLTYLRTFVDHAMTRKNFQLLSQAGVLERAINGFARGRILPAIIMSCSFGDVIVGSIILAATGDILFIRLFLVVFHLEVSVFLTLFLTFGAGIHSQGGEVLWFYRFHSKSKLERKLCCSVRPMRIEFCDNFIDTLTPLAVQRNITSETVSYSLLYKSS